MQMKRVTLTDRDYDRIVRALECYRGQCYINDDKLEMEEITSFLERIDNSPETDTKGKDYFVEKNRIYEKSPLKQREDNLQRYKIAQEIDIEKEIQKSQGTLVAGCKGDDCD